jgi:D-glycero-alpha-D-manno-heptose-7-phosphate kinase
VVITASTPIRVCDNGGWTDTWFGGPGRVFNIAVTPGVEVSIRPATGPDPVVVVVESMADRYTVVPGLTRIARHPLLEAAIDSLPPPDGLAVEVSVRSAVPAGCGTGTSASVAVAMLGALAALHPGRPSPRDIAYAAHHLEVDVLSAESGIQDQLSAAFGGINFIEIELYPEATIHTLPVWEDLSPRLTLLFLGRAHVSSDIHRQVMRDAQGRGSASFSQLRDAAVAARDAVLARNLSKLGQAMIANTEAQKGLHRELVGEDATQAIAVAGAQGALGWKVNGAGGDGGSVTFLSATPDVKEELEQRLAAVDPRYRVLPIRISVAGLQVEGAISEPSGDRPQ